MINLVKNELTKIFKKKNILIILIITFAFTILNNVIYKNINFNFEEAFDNQYIKQIKEEIKKLNPNDPIQKDEYIAILSDIEVYELKQKYKKDSWQRKIVENTGDEIIRSLNNAKYGKKNNDEYQEVKNEYDNLLNYLNKKTWKDYANYVIEKKKNNLEEINQMINTAPKDTTYIQTKNMLENEIYRLNIRLEKNIPFGNDYLNNAVETYDNSLNITLNEFKDMRKNELKASYNEQEIEDEYKNIITQNEESKYMIENKINLNDQQSLRYGLMYTLSNNTIFIIVITIMTAGTIVSSEFDKGTIKLLLIRPYKRSKILLSKFISSIIVLIISICLVYLFELIVGSLFFGIKDLNVPIIKYNILSNKTLHIGLFKYIIDEILTTLPQFLLLLTLSFSISTLLNNSAVAIAIPLIGSFVSDLITNLIKSFNINFLKYFVTLHWDLSQYLYGGSGLYKGFNMPLSILVCIVYFAIMIIPTFIVFKKKNIKNI